MTLELNLWFFEVKPLVIESSAIQTAGIDYLLMLPGKFISLAKQLVLNNVLRFIHTLVRYLT